MANRLADQSSPYLLQHAGNPVDWHPWGDEALRTARDRDRPILLSVGYSACHWCHVMAHECFEDPEIAALMNRLFVCIKVDREERPDIDAVYMQAVQAMTGQGGWPMTVFLTPEGAPYLGGTYFPPEPRSGLPAFPAVLRAAHDAYRNRRGDVERVAAALVRELAAPPLGDGAEPTAATLDRAVGLLVVQADRRHGGFGGAPKFPHPAALELLLRRGFAVSGSPASPSRPAAVAGPDPAPAPAPSRPAGVASPDTVAAVVGTTLRGMARGGIFDQLGGGFHRYSVDEAWTVPHFEKMLYDNAQLATVYLHAHQLGGDPEQRRVTEATLDYLVREMRLPGGGFASSQDADSEGEEGSFFLWSPEQVVSALAGRGDARLACALFGVEEAGSFAGDLSVLLLENDPAAVAKRLGVSAEALPEILGRIRTRLLEARSRRAAPGRDDKVVTAWNGFTLRAFAEAGTALDRPDYVEVARRCAGFLLSELVVGGRVRRSWRDGAAGVPGLLEDVAALGDGLLAVYEATGDPSLFASALALAEQAVARFRDPDGGYFDTAEDAEPLLVRPRGLEDNPVPAGRSIAAQLFVRLAGFTGEQRWRERALEIVRPLTSAIARVPLALASLACVADQLVSPSREVAVVGPADAAATRALLREVWGRRDPHRVLAWGPAGPVPLLADRPMLGGRPTAYVCEGFACRAPTNEVGELAVQLSAAPPW